MDDRVISSIVTHMKQERFATKLGLRLIKLAPGHAIVELSPQDDLTNLFGMTHGGAIFSLIDEAFELSCNTHGTIAVALSMTITYHRAPDLKSRLNAESVEIHRSSKTATYDIKVRDDCNTLIASCTALAYRKKDRLPFLEETEHGQGERTSRG